MGLSWIMHAILMHGYAPGPPCGLWLMHAILMHGYAPGPPSGAVAHACNPHAWLCTGTSLRGCGSCMQSSCTVTDLKHQEPLVELHTHSALLLVDSQYTSRSCVAM